MGRLAVAIGCIIVIAAGGILNLLFTSSLCNDMLSQIEISRRQVERTGTDDAHALAQAADLWNRRSVYLSAFIGHDRIDDVTTSYRRALAFARQESFDEYLAELLELEALVRVVRDFDRPTFRSIL